VSRQPTCSSIGLFSHVFYPNKTYKPLHQINSPSLIFKLGYSIYNRRVIILPLTWTTTMIFIAPKGKSILFPMILIFQPWISYTIGHFTP
jgi:hypothetical protein